MPQRSKQHAKTVVVALGGNAILQPGQVGTFEEQLVNVNQATRRVAQLIEDGWRIVLTHGNGPQVGNLLIQNALAAKTVAPMPMDVCGAESQGQIGYMLEQSLLNHLRKRHLDTPVVTLLTQIAVDAKDKAFDHPSKPVGPFYSQTEARRMMLEEGLAMREDAGRGWRRVVPSPEPKEIVPRKAIVDMVNNGICVICAGGGGVPVVRAASGALSGIDAVIDKDLAAALLAADVHADFLLILTDVAKAYVHYNTPEQTGLDTVTLSEMEAYAAAGHFKAGSMGPKVAACLRFVRTGGTAVIGSLVEVLPALRGEAGTRIIPDAAAKSKPRSKKPRTRTTAKGPAGPDSAGGGSRRPGARRKPSDSPTNRRGADRTGADVIDIGDARRRLAGGGS
jgi:carbamate kinase